MGDEAAAGDHDDLVDGLGHLGEEVAGDEDGATLGGEPAQHVAQPAHAVGVEPVGRLVEHAALPDRGQHGHRGGIDGVALRSTTSPSGTSEPARRDVRARLHRRQDLHARPPSSARVFSTGCTASAPGGTGAPVMICTAWPGASGAVGRPGPPAPGPPPRSATGAAATSCARTA